jgi:hypothetical protein
LLSFFLDNETFAENFEAFLSCELACFDLQKKSCQSGFCSFEEPEYNCFYKTRLPTTC